MPVLKDSLNNLKPEMFFACMASVFGLIVLFITPPFQVPDEPNHFYRAYQVSEGTLVAIQQDNRLGGYIPKSLPKISNSFTYLFWNKRAKINRKVILNQFDKPLGSNDKIFVDFPNTGLYSAVSYVPQSLAIFVLRNLNASPICLFYGARIFALLFWVVSIFFVIQMLPFSKWLFTFVLLLPMSIYINMSLSADVVSNILSFAVIAFILKVAYSGKAFGKRDYVVLLVLVVLLALAKLVYTPLILLFLLVPIRNYANKWGYCFQFGVLLLVTLSVLLFWSNEIRGLYIPYADYNKQFRDCGGILPVANMTEQLHYVLTHKFYILHVFKNSMIQSFGMYFGGYIGIFGWQDTRFPAWFIQMSYGMVLVVAILDVNRIVRIKLYQRGLLFLVFLIIISLVLLSQLLSWEKVGSSVVSVIQGRYFIPFAPLLFLLISNLFQKRVRFVIPLVVFVSVFNLSFTVATLYSRFYGQFQMDPLVFQCSAEQTSAGVYFTTSNPRVYVESAYSQSNEQRHSGSYSVKLSSGFSTGFVYRFLNVREGDSIRVEVWRKNGGGGIDITGRADFSVRDTTSIGRDSLGWNRLQLNVRVPKDMTREIVTLCVFNNSNNVVYFDDISVVYKRNKDNWGVRQNSLLCNILIICNKVT
jgi:uncharacterized membrane protein